MGDFSALSPMKLGPVMHGQKDVPPATSIENYHQFNKVRMDYDPKKN
jgi:hypothetical protein